MKAGVVRPMHLCGEELARARASMDVFAFPSSTDTFGNVALEAMASGVPPIVTSSGGPKFLLEHGISSFVANGDAELTQAVLELDTGQLRILSRRFHLPRKLGI